MLKLLPIDFFKFEFLRVLGTAPTHGCDVGECIDAAAKIRANDGESWYRAWSEAARKAEVVAEQASGSGDVVAARWAFLRASNYWRSSELYVFLRSSLRGNQRHMSKKANTSLSWAVRHAECCVRRFPHKTDASSRPSPDQSITSRTPAPYSTARLSFWRSPSETTAPTSLPTSISPTGLPSAAARSPSSSRSRASTRPRRSFTISPRRVLSRAGMRS